MLLKYLTTNKLCAEVGQSVRYVPALSHLLRLFNTEGRGGGEELPTVVSLLLECGAMLLDDCCPTFRDTVLVSSSKIKCSMKVSSFDIGPFKISRPATCPETWGTSRPATRRHIKEERRPQLHSCKRLNLTNIKRLGCTG
jgi:hypothetical protein